MKLARVLTLVMLVVLIASSVSAFDGMRKGFVLGGGLGFSPYTTWSFSEELFGFNVNFDESNVGIGLNLVIGYAWDEYNMLVYEGNVTGANSDLLDETISQGFNGASWYHYFGPQGKSFFTVVGLGFYVNKVGDYDADDPGGGYLFGGGYEFARHVQAAVYFSGGQTKSDGVTIGHNHFSILIGAVAF